jgi:rhamnogalacturonyl hydrolase YesR
VAHAGQSRRAAVAAAALLAWWAAAATAAGLASGVSTVDIGLAAGGERIDAMVIEATVRDAPTIAMVGGLQGKDVTESAVRAAAALYQSRRQRPVRLLAVPLANPGKVTLQFPPTGTAYRDHPESHALWRWLGSQAPDQVILAASEDFGLATALGTQSVAGMGRIPAQRWTDASDLLRWMEPDFWTGLKPAPSEAHLERTQRLSRTPRQLAEQLAQYYGRDFEQPWYIAAVALVGRLKLGQFEDVKRLAEPWVDGTRDSLARPNALVMAGHIVFTELARRTRDPRYEALVRKVADLGFDVNGQMLEAMPAHDRYSDSVFMGTTILAQAGALTGETKYFDMADRHLRFMQQLVLRPDGLYRHRSDADVAWGRGNGFAAIGLALTLSELPRQSNGYSHALASYRNLMQALLPLQNTEGLWRNVVNHPGAFAEYSGTAMIGFAMQRGLDRGWIRGREYRNAVDRAWQAVNARTSSTGALIDVCESTANLITLDQYLKRAALLGNDPRGGAMALLFATELME